MNMTVLFKKYTYGLLLIATTIISFCNAETIEDKIESNYYEGITANSSNYTNVFNYGQNGAGTYCIKMMSENPQTLTMGFANTQNGTPTNLYSLYNDQYGIRVCLYGNKPFLNIKPTNTTTIDIKIFNLQELLQTNITCEEEEISWSALFINDIQHEGKPTINIDIPEEIQRDYNYGSGETNIDVIGYGYDQEKMQQMVNTQFTPPTSEDLENVIGKIADFLPLLAIMLLIVYAWRLIKKVFKVF